MVENLTKKDFNEFLKPLNLQLCSEGNNIVNFNENRGLLLLCEKIDRNDLENKVMQRFFGFDPKIAYIMENGPYSINRKTLFVDDTRCYDVASQADYTPAWLEFLAKNHTANQSDYGQE